MHRRHSDYPISKLILKIFEASGLRASEFIKALGYKNIGSGLRRFSDWLEKGHGTEDFLERILHAFPLHEVAIRHAIKETIQIGRLEKEIDKLSNEVRKRKSFKPYIFIETESERPSQVVMAALAGFKMKVIHLPETVLLMDKPAIGNLVKELIQKHRKESNGVCLLYGKVTGYRFVFEWEKSALFDAEGSFIKAEEVHFEPEMAQVQIGNKKRDCSPLEEAFLKVQAPQGKGGEFDA